MLTANIPPIPDHLDQAAHAEWNRIAPILLAAGLVTDADMAALAAYCVCYARWQHAERQVQALGPVVKSPSGYPIKNPWLSIAEASLKEVRQWSNEFGMTPSSRTKAAKVAAKKTSGVEKYFAR